MVPDFSAPARQAEDREEAWDRFVVDLPVCRCCGRSVYPGDRYYETKCVVVCQFCMEELNENERVLEVS